MASPSEGTNFWVWLVLIGIAGAAAVIAGLVYIPPYFANSAVKQAVRTEIEKADPSMEDAILLNDINEDLRSAHASRYWVEDSKQEQADDLQLTSDEVTFTRDGNSQISADVEYTQTMWVPLLKKEKVFTYDIHVDGPSH